MVHISLSPNLEFDDVAAASSRLLFVWSWFGGGSIKKLYYAFGDYLHSPNVYLTNSGRSSLLVILRALSLKADDEVIIQSFTCNAVANPILWASLTPVYVDIDDTYNIDVEKLEEKITPRTKVIIAQHTFGIPARIDKILDIAKQHNIVVIEDCAHALGATYGGKQVGTLGDLALFSFGRDKVISSVYGGAILVNNDRFKGAVEAEYAKLTQPSIFWTLQQLLHPIITYKALTLYNWGGKYIIWLAQRLHLLSKAVTRGERTGKMPRYFPKKLPNPLAHLALHQLKKLEKFNNHRYKLAKIYEEGLSDNPDLKIVNNYDAGSIFLRYPIQHSDASDIIKAAKKEGVILGDWYRGVIAPEGTNLAAMNYKAGSCDSADASAASVINLPTNIRTSEEQAHKIIDLLNNYERKKRS